MLNEEHYKFAKQCGATHLVVHLVDYFGHNKKKQISQLERKMAGEKLGPTMKYGRLNICSN